MKLHQPRSHAEDFVLPEWSIQGRLSSGNARDTETEADGGQGEGLGEGGGRERKREGERDRQTDRQTEGQTETDTQTHRQIETETF